jgi:hypothetical protein
MGNLWYHKTWSIFTCQPPTWPPRAMHQQFYKWHKKKKKQKTPHILTHGAMRWCGLASMVVCRNGKTHVIWEGNMTTGSEIIIDNICFLGFQDIKEGMMFRTLISRGLGCIWLVHPNLYYISFLNVTPSLITRNPRECCSWFTPYS